VEPAWIAGLRCLSGALAGIEQEPLDCGIHALAPLAVEDVADTDGPVFFEAGKNVGRDRVQGVLVHDVFSHPSFIKIARGQIAAADAGGTMSAPLESEERTIRAIGLEMRKQRVIALASGRRFYRSVVIDSQVRITGSTNACELPKRDTSLGFIPKRI
jgi:hypothetical protein